MGSALEIVLSNSIDELYGGEEVGEYGLVRRSISVLVIARGSNKYEEGLLGELENEET